MIDAAPEAILAALADAGLGDAEDDDFDDAVEALSSLMEPIIIVFLGTLIGGIVVSMYLPIFKLGQVV